MPKIDVYKKIFEQRVKGVELEAEWRFHPTRRWRFDYAIPALKIAIEIDGGVWEYGRHNNPQGYINDMEKLNTAASMGWLVLRFTTDAKFETKSFDLINATVAYRKSIRVL